jgi:hypothetical protein
LPSRFRSCAPSKAAANRGLQWNSNEIRYFLALSKTLNFTEAAEMCGISQPALTRPDGARQADRTEVVARAGQSKQTAARFLKMEEAHLALGVMCTIAPVQFVSFLGRFRSHNPRVEVTVLEGVPEQLCNFLIEIYSERFVVACGRLSVCSQTRRAKGRVGVEFLLSQINCEYVDVLDNLERRLTIACPSTLRSSWLPLNVCSGSRLCKSRRRQCAVE